ncbi:MAG: OsmC family protein [Cytophagales bacterium]|nr:OsmC family protein [Cytophagales bacterium]
MINKTRYISDYVYEATNENGDSIQIDMREKDEKKGLSPTELLLSAVAGCAVVDIVSMLRKKRKTIKDIIVETEGWRNEDPPKKFNKIHSKYILISPDTTEEELRKVARLTIDKYCSVASSLNVKVDFSVEVIDK